MPLILKCHLLASHTWSQAEKSSGGPLQCWGWGSAGSSHSQSFPSVRLSCWHLRAGIPSKLLVVRNVQRVFETLTNRECQRSVLWFFGLCWVVIVVCGLSLVVARLVASLVAEHRLCRVHGLSSCGTQVQLWPLGLSCPQHVGILVPWPGIEPVSLELQGEFSATGPSGKSPKGLLFKEVFHQHSDMKERLYSTEFLNTSRRIQDRIKN